MSTRDLTAVSAGFSAARAALTNPQNQLPTDWQPDVGEIADKVVNAVLQARVDGGLARVRRLTGPQASFHQVGLIGGSEDLYVWANRSGMDWPVRAAIAAAAEAVVAVYGRQKKEAD